MKERQGQYAAKLANLLGAQAAILTVEGTGNTNVDYMLTVKALEEVGIAAIPIVHEFGGPDGKDWPLVDYVSEAVSIVSQGGVDRQLPVPAMARVIGSSTMYFTTGALSFSSVDAHNAFVADHQSFYCGFWQMGVAGVSASDF
jgi:glycine reductase